MTKSEKRKLRKAGELIDWNIERNEDGSLEWVRTRSRQEEQKHQAIMERWARWNYENE